MGREVVDVVEVVEVVEVVVADAVRCCILWYVVVLVVLNRFYNKNYRPSLIIIPHYYQLGPQYDQLGRAAAARSSKVAHTWWERRLLPKKKTNKNH